MFVLTNQKKMFIYTHYYIDYNQPESQKKTQYLMEIQTSYKVPVLKNDQEFTGNQKDNFIYTQVYNNYNQCIVYYVILVISNLIVICIQYLSNSVYVQWKDLWFDPVPLTLMVTQA